MQPDARAAAPGGSFYALLTAQRGPVMGAAALWILMFHTWVSVGSSHPRLFAVLDFVRRTGFAGVDIFFLFSGIGLVFAIGRGGLGRYYYRRLKRLLVPFLAGGLLTAIGLKWSFAQTFGALTGLSFWTEDIYTLLWFVPAISALYLVFPLYYRFFSRSKRPGLFTAAALAVWLAASLCAAGRLREDLFGFTNRVPVFLTGVWMGERGKRGWSVPWRRALPFCLPALALGLWLSYLTNYRGLYLLVPVSNCCVPNYLIALSLAPLAAWVAARVKPLARLLGFYGGFTLEFYCLQEINGAWLIPLLRRRLPPLAVNLAFLLFVTACAWLLSLAGAWLWRQLEGIHTRRQQIAP